MKTSQNNTRAGAGAAVLTLFAVAWNGIVWGLLMPERGPPIWFKGLFVLAGVLVAVGAVVSWRHRIRGGGASLGLAQDPVPHGVPTAVSFHLRKPQPMQNWTLDVLLETSQGPQSGFGRVWETSLPVSAVPSVVAGEILVQELSAEVTLPADLPSTQDKDHRAELVLKGNGLSWRFAIETRPGTASELAFHSDAPSLGSVPTPSRGEKDSLGERWNARKTDARQGGQSPKIRRVVHLLGWVFFAWLALDFSQSFLRKVPELGRLVSQYWPGRTVSDPARVGVAEAEKEVGPAWMNSEPFPITVTNWLTDGWRYRAHLQATGQLEQGRLRVRIERLSIMPVGPCNGSTDCRITQVGLLLSHDAGGHFNVLAQSEHLPWAVDLAQVHLAQRTGGEWVLTLPPELPSGDVRLKLVVQGEKNDPKTGKVGPFWVYPSDGNHLALRDAVVQAAGRHSGNRASACELVDSLQAVVRAGCEARLNELLQRDSGFDQASLDAALVDAVLHFNEVAVPHLLAAGASPDARDPSNPSHTALTCAAAGNELLAMQALVEAGAQVNHREVSQDQQIITPLTLALKRDSAAAVAYLLKAGAVWRDLDLNGWTVMHIAAFEGATDSLQVLAAAGGDVNQRARGYRNQTAFHTALQYAPQATIASMLGAGADVRLADDQGEDACGWARYFQRSPAIQGLVCRP
ncbi:MAG: ankyrin repeat domain-containing protein [Burkholderiaceae bacterium]